MVRIINMYLVQMGIVTEKLMTSTLMLEMTWIFECSQILYASLDKKTLPDMDFVILSSCMFVLVMSLAVSLVLFNSNFLCCELIQRLF